MISFARDSDGVTVIVGTGDGELTVRSRYLIGCDGGRSVVRKALDIGLSGQGNIRQLTQAIFRSEALYEAIPAGKGRHYYLPRGCSFTAQGDRKA